MDTKHLESTAPTIGFAWVETKSQGFKVTIFDLGRSKVFRSIWFKYYHEMKEVLRQILDKVCRKPILLLCNKSDLDEAQDEAHRQG